MFLIFLLFLLLLLLMLLLLLLLQGLRNSMEDRTATLLQFELEKSLSGIEASG